MFKKILIISILLILSIGVVSASENVTDDISATDVVGVDSADDVEKISVSEGDALQSTIPVSGKAFGDIENAIDKAKVNDVIQLSGTYTGSGNSIYVNKSITIQGDSNKAILDANGKSSIILASNDVKITLKNIIFKNSNDYAVIINSGGTIENCNFESNGYGISCSDFSESYNLIVKNSAFNNNRGNAINAQVKSLTVEKSTFTNTKNSAISLFSSQSTTISIKDSTFSGNAADIGGAVYAVLSKGTATISNCKFINNKASSFAGAFSLQADETFQLNILGSTFNSNSADKKSALSLDDTKANIKNNIFIKNTAKEDTIKSVGDIGQRSVLENNIIKEDVNANEKLGVEFLSAPAYFGDVFEVKFTKDGSVLANKKVTISAYKQGTYTNENFDAVTDDNGVAKFVFSSDSVNLVGVWDLQAIADSGSSNILASKNNINVKQLNAQIVSSDLTTTYASGQVLTLKLVNKNTNKIAGGVGLYVTIYKNGFYLKNVELKTNNNGVANLNLSKLPSAKYVVEINDALVIDENMKLAKASFKVKINKAPTKVSAPKVTNKFKKSKYFKVTVKAYNKPVKKLKVKVKVFTGKKSKTYSISTNSKGVAQLNTKSLSKGTHKVELSSGNANYKISAKSTIVIK